jgi:hypothetical protein
MSNVKINKSIILMFVRNPKISIQHQESNNKITKARDNANLKTQHGIISKI